MSILNIIDLNSFSPNENNLGACSLSTSMDSELHIKIFVIRNIIRNLHADQMRDLFMSMFSDSYKLPKRL